MASTAPHEIRLKRAYEAPGPNDGIRILIDRLWPRGITKEDAAIDHWFRDLAPSSELRRWFGHKAERWDEFQRRYAVELSHHEERIAELLRLARDAPVTLVFAARNEKHNNAVALRNILRDRSTGSRQR